MVAGLPRGRPARPSYATAAALLVVGGIVAATLSACSVSVGPLQERTNSYSVPGPVTALVVNDHVGSVHVSGDAAGAVYVTEHITYRDTRPKTSHVAAAGRVTLSDNCPAAETCGVTYEIRLPSSTSVQVSTVAGVLQLTSLTGRVTAHTGAGDIEITQLSGPVELTGHAGSVRGDLSSRVAILRSSVGGVDVTFTAVPDSVTATTAVGSVDLTVPGGVAYAVDARVTVGATHIGVPLDPASPHVIVASTRTGSVTVRPGP